MVDLVTGANIALTGSAWTITLHFPCDIRQDVGIVILPVNNATQLLIDPVFAHQSTAVDWLSADLTADGTTVKLSLDILRLPSDNVTRLLIVAYRYSASGPMSVAKQLGLQLDSLCTYNIELSEIDASALIVAEVYKKSTDWKLRALAETSTCGLAVLSRRLGMNVDDSSPYAVEHTQQTCANWTGTAFLVAPNVFMTNAHVVEGAQHIRLTSLQGSADAEIIICDSNNDIALLRTAMGSRIQPLSFRQIGVELAESVTTLGYPLGSIMGSGIQVTQGVISGVFGAHNDIRLLQFTASIQPGSSGSPLLDSNGAVLGIVSASFAQTQNMNFAIRGLLAIALMDAVKIPCTLQTKKPSNLSATQMVAQLQQAIWKVECRRAT